MLHELPINPLESSNYLEFHINNCANIRKMLANWVSGHKHGYGHLAIKSLKLTDNIVRRWLIRSDHPFKNEVFTIDDIVATPGYLTVSFGFSWGCTVKVDQHGNFIRALDWNFHELGKFLQVIVMKPDNNQKPYLTFSWPGLTGLYQVIAPERFTITINQAPMPEYKFLPSPINWAINRISTFTNYQAIDPSHLLRQVANTSPDYQTALATLANTPLCIPCIFTIANHDNSRGCIIERTQNAANIIGFNEKKYLVTANNFTKDPGQSNIIWSARGFDNNLRYEQACELEITNDLNHDPLLLLDKLNYPLINSDTKMLMWSNLTTQNIAVVALDDKQQAWGIYCGEASCDAFKKLYSSKE